MTREEANEKQRARRASPEAKAKEVVANRKSRLKKKADKIGLDRSPYDLKRLAEGCECSWCNTTRAKLAQVKL